MRIESKVVTGAVSRNADRLNAPDWTRLWLWILIALVIVMVSIGGATRLTGSGLSITEWKPITGAIPPLSEAAWLGEFEKYRQSSQYELLNAGMSLAQFKSIYWWEWGHRQFGRLLGLVFLAPFLVLAAGWLTRRVSGTLLVALAGIGVLGGLQAAVGWLMVVSGLQPGMTAVEPVKLMLHLVVASIILLGLATLVRGVSPLARSEIPSHLNVMAKAIVVMLLIQIAFGALVAGAKAGLTYNTWPLMDGRLVPSFGDLFVVTPWYENFFDNAAMVQFQHRLMAYCLVGVVVCYAWLLRQAVPGSHIARQAMLLAGFVLLQGLLGIVTLVLMVPLWAALAHQVLAVMTLTVGAYHAASVAGKIEIFPARKREPPIILDMDQTFNA